MKNSASAIFCTKVALIERLIQVRHDNPRNEELSNKYISGMPASVKALVTSKGSPNKY